MTKKRPQVGDLIHVVFWDHAENGDAIRFEVIGRLMATNRRFIKVGCWLYVDPVDKAGDANTSNETFFSIVKSATESVRVLK